MIALDFPIKVANMFNNFSHHLMDLERFLNNTYKHSVLILQCSCNFPYNGPKKKKKNILRILDKTGFTDQIVYVTH